MTGLGTASSWEAATPARCTRGFRPFCKTERYVALADVPNLATSSRRLLTPIFAKTDLR